MPNKTIDIFGKEFVKLNLLNQKDNKRIDVYIHQIGCKGFKEDSFFNNIKFYLNKKEQEEQLKYLNQYIFKEENKYNKIYWWDDDGNQYFGIMKNSKEFIDLIK